MQTATDNLPSSRTRFRLSEAAYFLRFGLESVFSGKRKPIAAGVPLTDSCNLSCRHCVVRNGALGHHPFSRICSWMDELFSAGAKILYLQGGEILLWEEGPLRPNDVIKAARERGFFKIAAVTNGTLPLQLDVDALWVSVDGPPEIHDTIRGKGAFAALNDNVTASSHPRIYANCTINTINAPFLDETIAAIEHIRNFRGISINFHTPYYGVETLALPQEQRVAIVNKLLALKRAGHRIVNSSAGLKLLASQRYRRPIGMIRLVEQGRVFECCWGREQKGVCDRCGYGIIAEMSAMAALRPSAILSGLKLF
jgi:MoaA/NifB/PqqE/SkfB family radical SAM enzyme